MRFNNDRLPAAMVRNGRSGWYYRVLQPGAVRAGDAVTLVDRPQPDFPFERLVEIVYRSNANPEEMASLARMTEFASDIRNKARRKLGLA